MGVGIGERVLFHIKFMLCDAHFFGLGVLGPLLSLRLRFNIFFLKGPLKLKSFRTLQLALDFEP